jgi:hypothetical protein
MARRSRKLTSTLFAVLVRNSGRVGAKSIMVILKQSVAELQQLVRPPACPRSGHVPERSGQPS